MTEVFYTRPIFYSSSVEESIRYYRDILGFDLAWSSGEDKPIIAQVSRDGVDLILDQASVIPKPSLPSVLSLTLHRSEMILELHREFVDRGARVLRPPFEVVWQQGTFQFDVEDLDGNLLIFWGEPRKSGVQGRSGDQAAQS